MPVNYQNGKLYRLVHTPTGREYIGSTAATLKHRKGTHMHFGFVKQYPRGLLYPFMAATKQDDWHIVLIRAVPCNSKDELEREEYLEIQALPDKSHLLNVQQQQGVMAESTRALLRATKLPVSAGGTMPDEQHAQVVERNRLAQLPVSAGGTMPDEQHAQVVERNRLAHLPVSAGGTMPDEQHAQVVAANRAGHRAASRIIAHQNGLWYCSWNAGGNQYIVYGPEGRVKCIGVTRKRTKEQALQASIDLVKQLAQPETELTAVPGLDHHADQVVGPVQ